MTGLATRSWREQNEWIADLLERRTGATVDDWKARIEREASHVTDERSLREWLGAHGVTGYPQNLLVMERFGYPEFLTASADELVEAQYADRPTLRPIYDAVLAAAAAVGEVTVQTRKTYVSLLTPRRTFAAVQPTTRTRVDLGLRLDAPIAGRLLSAGTMGSGQVTRRVGLSSVEEIDDEVDAWLREAYAQNS